MKKPLAIVSILILAGLTLNSVGATEGRVTGHHWSQFNRLWTKVVRLSGHVRALEKKSKGLQTDIVGLQKDSDELREKVQVLEEKLAAPQTISWRHTITADEISGTGNFRTVQLADSRVQKDAAVSVYVVGSDKNVSFESINAAYNITLADGKLSLTTAWANNQMGTSSPVGVELLIFLTYTH